MNVFCLGAEQIDNLYPQFAHHLTRLESETGLILADAIREDLKTAHRQLWGYQSGQDITGIVITEIYDTPRGKCCEIVGACGRETAKGQIEEVMARIEQWAQDIGCTRVRVLGRRGWARRLKGFTQVGIILERELGQ